ncbi:hypothetical protein IOC57_24505 [Bacillus sp. SD075]|uniref:hypothetical protein n=1 Tax=Bacillus sp. SD075 TaxID=2781732 RepID=UPI001A958FA2|nr:hypothetical protein [Bacillus sp. SD075]MBO1000881.1 hypothetical protein [Bacillus sp. SD075]
MSTNIKMRYINVKRDQIPVNAQELIPPLGFMRPKMAEVLVRGMMTNDGEYVNVNAFKEMIQKLDAFWIRSGKAKHKSIT